MLSIVINTKLLHASYLKAIDNKRIICRSAKSFPVNTDAIFKPYLILHCFVFLFFKQLKFPSFSRPLTDLFELKLWGCSNSVFTRKEISSQVPCKCQSYLLIYWSSTQVVKFRISLFNNLWKGRWDLFILILRVSSLIIFFLKLRKILYFWNNINFSL